MPIDQKTKLCADPNCKDDLFPSQFVRTYDSNDVTFLKAKESAPVKIIAFRFSDRPDLLEAEDNEGKKGLIFEGHIDQTPYVIFLESALKRNQTLYMVERVGVGDWSKQIKEVNAFPELLRMYITYANKLGNYQLDKDLIAQITKFEESQKKTKTHNPNGQQQQKNSNAGMFNAKADKKVDNNVRSEMRTNEENEKSNDVMQKKQSEDPKDQQRNTERELEQQKDKVGQNPDGGTESQPEKVTDFGQQQNLAQMSHESKREISPTYESNNIEATEKATEANTQYRQQMPQLSDGPPQQTKSMQQITTPPSKAQSGQTAQQQNPKSQMQQNQHEDSPQSHQTQLQHTESVQQRTNPSSGSQEDQTSQQQNPTSQSQQNQHKVPPQSHQLTESVQQRTNPSSGSQNPTSQIQQNPSNNDRLESNSIQEQTNFQQKPAEVNFPNPELGQNLPQQSQIHQSDSQQMPQFQPQAIATETNQPSSTQQQNPSPQFNNVNDDYQQNSAQQPELQVMSSTISPPSSTQQSDAVENSITIPPELDKTTQSIERMHVEQDSAEENNRKMGEAAKKSDDRQQIKVAESRNQPQERPLPISGDAVPVQKSIETGTPIDESITTQQREITTDQKEEKSAEILREGILDATQKTEGLEGDKSIDRTEQQPQQQNYCFKEDCKELDHHNSNSDQSQHQKVSPNPSALSRMFHEWMGSLRSVLPEPLCNFEDTGLIVLAFVITAFVIHLINLLFSSGSGPEPFNHRLLHDCITRLKEQEVIIEKVNKNAAINQHLVEAANAAEHLQKHNEALEKGLKSAEKRVLELEAENGKVKQTNKNMGYELEQSQALAVELKASVENKEAELKKSNSTHQKIESELSDALNKLAQSQNKEKYLEQDLKEAQLQLDRVKLELNEAQKEVVTKRNECAEKTAEIDELLGVVAELNKDKIGGRGKCKEKEEGKRKSQQKPTPIDKQNMDHSGSSAASSPGQTTSLLEAAEVDPDNGAGSGGSAGWSDLGDGMEIPGADSEPPGGGKLLDILELAKLKSRLRSLETERDQIKLTMKVAQEEKEHLAKDVERLRQELVEKERDSEQRELDRHGLTQQCTKLLQMIEEKERKVEHSEQEREKLRTRLSEAEMGLLRVEDEKRELQHRIKELEQSLKQSTEQNGRLENKFYHEERRLNSKIRQLDEQLALAKSSLSPVNMSGGGLSADLNMSANSSDQGFVPLSSPDGGGARGGNGIGIPSLWSEIDANEPVEELVSLERKALRRRSIRSGTAAGEMSRESPFLNDIVHVNKLGREERLLNSSKFSSGASVRSANLPRQRMRSRSAGRQSVARLTGIRPNMYGTVDPSLHPQRTSAVPYQSSSGKNSPFRQQERPQSAARLKTTVVGGINAYSSDSNDASSPPPEMPLLSGVPPPGLHKRPTVYVPASRPNVQLHKPSAAPK